MLNPQAGGRLDAKRHSVILAQALNGIRPVGHACAVLCCGTAGAFLRVEHPFARKFEALIFLTSLPLVGVLGTIFFRNLVPAFFDMGVGRNICSGKIA